MFKSLFETQVNFSNNGALKVYNVDPLFFIIIYARGEGGHCAVEC